MASPAQKGSRRFRLEGGRKELQALADVIGRALQNKGGSEESPSEGTVGSLRIEVKLLKGSGALAVRPGSRDEAVVLLDGWAENIKCANCEIPVALLFEDEYYESSTGRGAVCADCLQKELDDESS